MCSHEENVGF